MIYCSKKNKLRAGFTLAEAVAALLILAFLSVAVLIVIDRCMAAAADSLLSASALELARENMESLLTSDLLEEKTEYGQSDKYPAVTWKTTVKYFDEPQTEMTWLAAVCSADYTDSAGDKQTIELTHWITNLTEKQAEQLRQRQQQTEPNQTQPEREDETEPESNKTPNVPDLNDLLKEPLK